MIIIKKYVLYGKFARIFDILESFPGLYDYVDCVIFSDYYKDDFTKKIEFYYIDNFDFEKYRTREYVISGVEIFEEISNILIKKGVKSNFYKMTDWLLYMLENHDDIVQKPYKIRLELSTLCQLNCKSCYMRKDNYGKVGKGYLTFVNFKRFIDENYYIKKIEISNSGEVFLNPDVKKILEYCFKKNIEITISNGTNFNSIKEDVIEALVKYNVREVLFSIDGACQEVYEKYRVNGNFDRVISNIKKLNYYKEKYNSMFPKLKWQYIVFEHNVCDIEKAIKMSEVLNMSMIFKKDWENSFVPSDVSRIKDLTGLDYSMDYCNSDISENCDENNNYVDIVDNVDKKEIKKYISNDICSQMLFEPQINFDGKLLGCCTVYQGDWGGNVFDDGFMNCLNSLKYRQGIYNLLGKPNSDSTPCDFCYTYRDNVLNNIFLDL